MSTENGSAKALRFKNVASKRVQKVLDSLDGLAKCANKNNYEYSNADVSKMLRAIKDKVKALELSYSTNSKSDKEFFEF